jgi:ABC-type amino acid transport system permease subunit
MFRNVPVLLTLYLLGGCAVAQLDPAAAHVRLTGNSDITKNCEYLGEVIGTEGHWYTFLFLANETLMQAALDDLRNNAAAKGANLVYIDDPHNFNTSVTLLGLAYNCKK